MVSAISASSTRWLCAAKRVSSTKTISSGVGVLGVAGVGAMAPAPRCACDVGPQVRQVSRAVAGPCVLQFWLDPGCTAGAAPAPGAAGAVPSGTGTACDAIAYSRRSPDVASPLHADRPPGFHASMTSPTLTVLGAALAAALLLSACRAEQ